MKRRAAPRLGNHLLYSVDFTLRRITCITITGNFIVQRLALAILLPGDLTRNRTISQTLYQSVVSQIVLYSFLWYFWIFGFFQSILHRQHCGLIIHKRWTGRRCYLVYPSGQPTFQYLRFTQGEDLNKSFELFICTFVVITASSRCYMWCFDMKITLFKIKVLHVKITLFKIVFLIVLCFTWNFHFLSLRYI